MTSAQLTFQRQHLCWQQRVGTERKKTLNYHGDNDMQMTFYNNYPDYLEKLDNMKACTFKMQHPLRFHDSSKPLMENRYDPERNRAYANNTLQPQHSVDPNAIGQKKGLRDILEQNNLYDEVLNQINNRLTMRQTMKSGTSYSAQSEMQDLASQGAKSVGKSSRHSRFKSVGSQIKSGQALPAIKKPGSDLARQVANAIKVPLQARSVTKMTPVQSNSAMSRRSGSQQASRRSRAPTHPSVFSRTEPNGNAPSNSMINQLQRQIQLEKQQSTSLKNRLVALSQTSRNQE